MTTNNKTTNQIEYTIDNQENQIDDSMKIKKILGILLARVDII